MLPVGVNVPAVCAIATAETSNPKMKLVATFLPQTLAETDGNFVAGSAEVDQTNRDVISGCEAARHADVHLVQTGISRSVAEEQDFRKPAADRHLRRDHTAVKQTCGVHCQSLA